MIKKILIFSFIVSATYQIKSQTIEEAFDFIRTNLYKCEAYYTSHHGGGTEMHTRFIYTGVDISKRLFMDFSIIVIKLSFILDNDDFVISSVWDQTIRINLKQIADVTWGEDSWYDMNNEISNYFRIEGSSDCIYVKEQYSMRYKKPNKEVYEDNRSSYKFYVQNKDDIPERIFKAFKIIVDKVSENKSKF